MNAPLAKRICPGCGRLDPVNRFNGNYGAAFECKCGWESDDGLPTIGEIMRDGKFTDCNNVNLSSMFKSLFSDE